MVSGLSQRRALAGAGGVYAVLTLLLVGLTAWQWVALSQVTALRNPEMHQKDEYTEWAEVVPGLVLAGALVTLAVAVTAGLASLCKTHRALLAFAVCCACATLVLVVIGSLAVTKTEDVQIDGYVRISLYDTFHPMRNGGRAETEAFGAVERALICCGVDGPWEYRYSTVHQSEHRAPDSCCGDRGALCDINSHEVNARVGCAAAATESITTAYRWAGAGVLLASCICAVGPALAWMLYVAVRPAKDQTDPSDSDEPGDE